MFGTNPAFRQLLPRPVVDCQRFTTSRANADTRDRWSDRLVLDENLVRSWRSLIHDLVRESCRASLPCRPRIRCAATTRRPTIGRSASPWSTCSSTRTTLTTRARRLSATTPTRRSSGIPAMRSPRTAIYWSPGEKEVRNPRIVLAFRRIGLSEHAGWGLRGHLPQLAAIGERAAADHERQTAQGLRTPAEQGGSALRAAAYAPPAAWSPPHRRSGPRPRAGVPRAEPDALADRNGHWPSPAPLRSRSPTSWLAKR